jgi:hypothetical protein
MSSSAVGALGLERPRPGEAQGEPQDPAAGQGVADVARVLRKKSGKKKR